MNQQTLTLHVADSVAQEAVVKTLQSLGLQQDSDKSEYTLWRMRGEGVVAILYTSGKLVVQGIKASQIVNELDLMKRSDKKFTAHIGVDEVGKGDYFGPLVVVAAYVSGDTVGELEKLGVGDSKKLSDSRIRELGAKLQEILSHREIAVTPSEYAELNSELGNVSILLAQKHAQAVSELDGVLKEDGVVCEEVVFDQFSKRKDRLVKELAQRGVTMGISQFHKGESDIAVAAASILARYYFLQRWDQMESEYEFQFPKGASEVIDAGKEFVAKFGAQELEKVAKVSFKTTGQILQLF